MPAKKILTRTVALPAALALVLAAAPGCCHTQNAIEFATDPFDDGGGAGAALVLKPLAGIAVLPIAVALDLAFNVNPFWHVIWVFGTAGGHGDKWLSGC